MLKHIQEFMAYAEITGFRNVEIRDPAYLLNAIRREQREITVQLLNAELIATWQHLYFALINALTAFYTKRNISKKVAVEIILYASAQRQIRKAIELIGVKCNTANVAVVITSEDQDAVASALNSVSKHTRSKPDETVLGLSEGKISKIRSAFNISEIELKTIEKSDAIQQGLVDIVCERMALLSTRI